MCYSIVQLSEKTGVSQRALRDAISNGDLIPMYSGSKDGKAQITDVEYNRWVLKMNYGDKPGLLEEAMKVLNISVGA